MNTIPVLIDRNVLKLENSLKKQIHARYLNSGLPFVTLKFAQTLDGKIATLSGDSKWISGPVSLKFTHRLRSFHDAILVGVETIIQDDPRLTVRLVKGKNPLRVIIDSRLRTPLDSKILYGRSAHSTIIATTPLSSPQRIKKYQSKGADVWVIKKDKSNRVHLPTMLRKLGQRGIRSILVEGGSETIHSFLESCLVNHLFVFIAPKIVGKGKIGLDTPISYLFKNSTPFSHFGIFKSGDDILLSFPVHK
jgi:diaminohydroxyphosphoribosylaminopyrimidine deaminase/5-amino-6-(5-phosphoribosylamino)uracil reductase